MTIPNDPAFYELREKQERDLAAKAIDPSIRAIHAKMADDYALQAAAGRRAAELRQRTIY